jgi:hypothetical protein
MSSDAFLMLWRPEGGPTVVLPFVDEGGEMAPMAREIADVFDERGVSPDAAFWRMVAGDRAEVIARQDLRIKRLEELVDEQVAMSDELRAMFREKVDYKE